MEPSKEAGNVVYNKVCLFDILHVFNNDLTLRFYNQSEIDSEDNTIYTLVILWWQLKHYINTPYMSNLTKFWLRYLRLKTYDDIIILFS